MWNNLSSYSLRCSPLYSYSSSFHTTHGFSHSFSLLICLSCSISFKYRNLFASHSWDDFERFYFLSCSFSCFLFGLYFFVLAVLLSVFVSFVCVCIECANAVRLNSSSSSNSNKSGGNDKQQKKTRQIPLQQYDSFAGRIEFGADIQNIHRYRCTQNICTLIRIHTLDNFRAAAATIPYHKHWVECSQMKRNMHKRAHSHSQPSDSISTRKRSDRRIICQYIRNCITLLSGILPVAFSFSSVTTAIFICLCLRLKLFASGNTIQKSYCKFSLC